MVTEVNEPSREGCNLIMYACVYLFVCVYVFVCVCLSVCACCYVYLRESTEGIFTKTIQNLC